MKKVLLSAIIATAAIIMSANANAQSFHANVKCVNTRQAFYYYPKANVYYNVSSRQYFYPRNGGWVSVNFLPINFRITNEPRFTVYHYGPEVWRDNHIHYVTYRRYAEPVVVYNNHGRDASGNFGNRDASGNYNNRYHR